MKLFIVCILTLWATDATAEYDPFVEVMKELEYKWDCGGAFCFHQFTILETLAGEGFVTSYPKHFVCNCSVNHINKFEITGSVCRVKRIDGVRTKNYSIKGPFHKISKVPVQNTRMTTSCRCHITTDTAKLAESLNLPEPPLKQGNCQIRTLHGSNHTNKQQLVECLKEGGIPLDENDNLKEEERGKFNFHFQITNATIFGRDMQNESIPHYVELVIDKTNYNHVEYDPKGGVFETIMNCLVKLKLVNTLIHLAIEKNDLCQFANGYFPVSEGRQSSYQIACRPF